jgi:hypothetical protein
LDEVTAYNFYVLNKEKGYDTEITSDPEKKTVSINGNNIQLSIFIQIDDEVEER